jgi:hypothetical protein
LYLHQSTLTVCREVYCQLRGRRLRSVRLNSENDKRYMRRQQSQTSNIISRDLKRKEKRNHTKSYASENDHDCMREVSCSRNAAPKFENLRPPQCIPMLFPYFVWTSASTFAYSSCGSSNTYQTSFGTSLKAFSNRSGLFFFSSSMPSTPMTLRI